MKVITRSLVDLERTVNRPGREKSLLVKVN